MIGTILSTVAGPIINILKQRGERKAAIEQATVEMQRAKQDGDHKIQLNEQQLEAVLAGGLGQSWKDEFVTIVVVSPFALIVAGGILSAFGIPQVLDGVVIAINTMNQADVEVGFLMKAVILSAVGLSVWRRV